MKDFNIDIKPSPEISQKVGVRGRHLRLKVSVSVCAYNEEKYIGKLLRALLDQTFNDFEIVLIDDNSNDNTLKIVKSFSDSRIRYVRNDTRLGYARSSNKSLQFCAGDYVFFTGGDCVVANDWIEQGLKCFETENCAGVEGTICYVSKEYRPTYSDYVMRNDAPGSFMTGCMAYRRSVLKEVGGFDERYTYGSDRNLGLKVLRAGGRIIFNQDMRVFHPQHIRGIREFVQTAERVKVRVLFFKEFRDKPNIIWRVFAPADLFEILFPPAILVSLLVNRYRKWDDFKLLPFIFVRAVYERYCLWRECIRERVFLI